MAKWHIYTLVPGILAFALAGAAFAQEAALETESGSLHSHQGVGQHGQLQPVSSSSASENKSNLKHWTQFSHSSSKPFFVKVPAGTKVAAASPARYLRPQHLEAGKVQALPAQDPNAPSKRYLAYNVPAGAFVKKKQVSPPVLAQKTPASKPASKNNGQTAPTIAVVQVLSYGHKPGQIKAHYVPAHRHQRPVVSSYSTYY